MVEISRTLLTTASCSCSGGERALHFHRWTTIGVGSDTALGRKKMWAPPRLRGQWVPSLVKRSSAINQLINQLINQSTNQSNHQSISGPSCRFACKASQEHKRVKGNLISGFLFKKIRTHRIACVGWLYPQS